MKPTEITAGQFEIVSVSDPASIDQRTWQSAISTYQEAFAQKPYEEAFDADEAEAALRYVLAQDGDLLIGTLGSNAVSLAGGYRKSDGTYYIGELAVSPSKQGNGYGRLMLDALLETATRHEPGRYEIRTTIQNKKAIALYESAGFALEHGTEVVSQARQGGAVELDERVYLSRPPVSIRERLGALKRVAVVYPSGNTTAVVYDQLLGGDRKALNDQLMAAWKSQYADQPEIEQCCFVTLPRDPKSIARVEMFGGEFCGNATRSVVRLLTQGKDYDGFIEVSGVDRPLACRVRDNQISLEMPLPETGDLVQCVQEGSLVRLDGITQLVVTKPDENRTPRQLLTSLLQANKYTLAEHAAVGVSYYNVMSGEAQFCVWVKAVDTIFDETACGSGTCAIGVALASEARQSLRLNVIQPSGEPIRTEATYQGRDVTKSVIAGEVSTLYDGELTLI